MLGIFLNKGVYTEDGHSGLLDVKLDLDSSKKKIVYDVENWFRILFALKGRTCPIIPWTIVMLTTTAFILIDDKYGYSILGKGVMNRDVNHVVHSTFGIVVGFLIVYQSTQSSKRWWEGRVAWENIMTHSREVMRILCAHCNGRRIIKLFGKYTIAFSITSKHYLRRKIFTKSKPCPELCQILPYDDAERLYQIACRYRPLACLYALQRIIEISIVQDLYSRPVARDLNPRLVQMADELGTCERIMYTPLPWVYTLHLRIVLIVYLMLTPLGMFNARPLPGELQVYLYTAILAYVFLGLEDMAAKIQNPFGYNISHLPLDTFTFTIFRDVKEIISMKYNSFDKTYTEKIYQLGKYEIEWWRKHGLEEDEDADEEGDD